MATFKRIELEDIEAISRVHRDACLLAYRFMNWSYPLQEVEDWYSQKFLGWTWTLAAICPETRIVGFIAMIGLHIDQLFVDPACQRLRVGSQLLRAAIHAHPGRLTLDVFEENLGARAFYEEHGFSACDRWMNEEEGVVDLLYVRE